MLWNDRHRACCGWRLQRCCWCCYVLPATYTLSMLHGGKDPVSIWGLGGWLGQEGDLPLRLTKCASWYLGLYTLVLLIDGKEGGFGMAPWCLVLVCSWRCPLADRHSLPFTWTLSLHRRWCPSAWKEGGGGVD